MPTLDQMPSLRVCTNPSPLRGRDSAPAAWVALDALRHFHLEGNPAAVSVSGLCSYRTFPGGEPPAGAAPMGCGCPVGRLLPDDLYDPAIEGCYVSDLPETWHDALPDLTGLPPGVSEVEFYGMLQRFHDKIGRGADLEDALDAVVTRFGCDVLRPLLRQALRCQAASAWPYERETAGRGCSAGLPV